MMLPLQVSMFLEVVQIDYEHARTTPGQYKGVP